ncbi:MAG: putative oxidoreductase [candidate division WS6 bacterium OLB20]|uniref:Putative oxidoreductase n=1 Tax=candidate division WS6 bacterium OLB20 TaxID=1617426 RepID=A0A136LZY5_9BACT|nr:MAG: putative oxidoreductase [candidate division WS6 bacterium OLB20]
MKLQHKTVLITGASSGIGRDFALRAAPDGAHFILSARSIDRLNNLKSEIESLGSTAEVIACDVTDTEQVRELLLASTADGRKLDLVLNNAGLGHIANIWELTTEEIQEIIDVNISGMIMVAKFAAEVFTRQKSGHLMFTSSLAGLITLPQWSVYVASKWAITGFADCIRAELSDYGVQVTTVHPGAVRTEFFDADKADVDISRLGDAIDVREVSDAIYDAALTDTERVLIPGTTRVFGTLYRYAPGIVKRLIKNMTDKVSYHDVTEEDEPGFDR